MTDSILNSTKKNLGLAADYTAFDPDITMHINGVLSTLNQLGIGPANGFSIEDADDLWVTFLGGEPRLNSVKTYVYLRVKLLFDPPTTSYLIEALNKQVAELEWRLTVLMDAIASEESSSEPTPSSLAAHVQSETPHPVYDDGPSLSLLYENLKV